MPLTITVEETEFPTSIRIKGTVEGDELCGAVADARWREIVLKLHQAECLGAEAVDLPVRVHAVSAKPCKHVRLCGVSRRAWQLLRFYERERLFEIYETEEEAIAALPRGIGLSVLLSVFSLGI